MRAASRFRVRASWPTARKRRSPKGGREHAKKNIAKKPVDPALSIPTPLMVEPSALDKLETIATRPLETPSRVSTPPESKRKRSIAPFAAIALVVVVGLVVWRSKATITPTAEPPNTPTPANVVSAPVPPSTAASSSVTTAPSIVPPLPSSLAVVTSNPPSTAVHAPSTSAPNPNPPTSSSAVVPGRAMVSFLGDPGTKVSVDGASRGACPVRLALEPGQHEVRFVFEPTGESRGERFSVKANERVTVRAEFTGATPTVRIQH